jgi:hypothetical protein
MVAGIVMLAVAVIFWCLSSEARRHLTPEALVALERARAAIKTPFRGDLIFTDALAKRESRATA